MTGGGDAAYPRPARVTIGVEAETGKPFYLDGVALSESVVEVAYLGHSPTRPGDDIEIDGEPRLITAMEHRIWRPEGSTAPPDAFQGRTALAHRPLDPAPRPPVG